MAKFVVGFLFFLAPFIAFKAVWNNKMFAGVIADAAIIVCCAGSMAWGGWMVVTGSIDILNDYVNAPIAASVPPETQAKLQQAYGQIELLQNQLNAALHQIASMQIEQ